MVVNNPVKFGYPCDNSYSICLTDSTIPPPRLAGTYNTPAKLVKIISKPYTQWIPYFGGIEEEFVNVLYEGNKYRVLNNIRDKPSDIRALDY